jgi:3'-phosphoadenosine 5'-phosphosulfate sulfotransferase (PAPS reductase)/FAD synthetase
MISPPPIIHKALKAGASLAVSISGGKDSQAMLKALSGLWCEMNYPGEIFVIHAHLGRAEWPQTLPHCRSLAATYDIPLIVVERPQGDLVDEIKARMQKLAGSGKPFWPSASNRYCTSDQKRDQIDKVLRAPFWPDAKNRYCTSHHKTNQIDKEFRHHNLIISAEGIRWDESPARSKKPEYEIRTQITAKPLRELSIEDALDYRSLNQRLAITWRPIISWSKAQVYEYCGHSLEELEIRRELYKFGYYELALNDWSMHPAYVFGNDRLSCVLCILGSLNDLRTGAEHNPGLLDVYIELEEVGGFTFKKGFSLRELTAADQDN